MMADVNPHESAATIKTSPTPEPRHSALPPSLHSLILHSNITPRGMPRISECHKILGTPDLRLLAHFENLNIHRQLTTPLSSPPRLYKSEVPSASISFPPRASSFTVDPSSGPERPPHGQQATRYEPYTRERRAEGSPAKVNQIKASPSKPSPPLPPTVQSPSHLEAAGMLAAFPRYHLRPAPPHPVGKLSPPADHSADLPASYPVASSEKSNHAPRPVVDYRPPPPPHVPFWRLHPIHPMTQTRALHSSHHLPAAQPLRPIPYSLMTGTPLLPPPVCPQISDYNAAHRYPFAANATYPGERAPHYPNLNSYRFPQHHEPSANPTTSTSAYSLSGHTPLPGSLADIREDKEGR